MKEISLDKFVAPRIKDKKLWPRNQYVSFPGWKHLYVRVTLRMLNNKMYEPVIDLANIEADEPGKGTFKKLVKHLQKTYPTATLHVEEVLNDQFLEGLPKMGFIPLHLNPHSFFLAPS